MALSIVRRGGRAGTVLRRLTTTTVPAIGTRRSVCYYSNNKNGSNLLLLAKKPILPTNYIVFGSLKTKFGGINSNYATASKKTSTRKQSTSTKSKTKKKVKKELTPEQKEKRKEKAKKLKIKELKAVVIDPPKKLPVNARNLAIQEKIAALKDKYTNHKDAFKAAAEEVTSLSSYEQQVGVLISFYFFQTNTILHTTNLFFFFLGLEIRSARGTKCSGKCGSI